MKLKLHDSTNAIVILDMFKQYSKHKIIKILYFDCSMSNCYIVNLQEM